MSTPLSRVMQARLSYLGLTKEELADRSGLGRSTIYAFANGTRSDPQGSTLRKLAAGLSLTPGELVQEVNGMPALTANMDERIARIIQLLPGVPKDRLDAIEQHVTLAIQPGPRTGSAHRTAANASSDTGVNPPGAPINRRRRGQQPPLTVRHRALMLTKMVGTWAAIVSLFSRDYHPLSPPAAATA